MSKNTFAKEKKKKKTPSTVSCIFFLVPLVLLHPLPPARIIFLLAALVRVLARLLEVSKAGVLVFLLSLAVSMEWVGS